MAISTHKMLADSDIENTARIAPKDSYGAATKHFFNCTETASPLADVVGGLELPADGVNASHEVTIGAGDDSGVNTRLLAYTGGQATLPVITGGTWTQPGSSNVVLVACGKCRIDPAARDSDINMGGFTGLYIGQSSTGILRIQPYQAIFQIDADRFATPFYAQNAVRSEGDIHIYATVMRGTRLEHYADGVLTGSRDYANQAAALKTAWDNFTPDTGIACGHGASCSDIAICTDDICVEEELYAPLTCTLPNMTETITVFDAKISCDFSDETRYLRAPGRKEISGTFNPIDGNNNATGQYADDIYGLYFGVFDSAPSQQEIINGINYMKTEWVAGNKAIYPGWMFS